MRRQLCLPTFLAKPVQMELGRPCGSGRAQELKPGIEEELHGFERFQLAEEVSRTAPAPATAGVAQRSSEAPAAIPKP